MIKYVKLYIYTYMCNAFGNLTIFLDAQPLD
jgi:hypothetical protein